MKRSFVTLLLLLSVSLSFAQTQDGSDYGKRKFYCEVKCYEKGVSSNSKIVFEFGETVSREIWGYSNCKVRFVNDNGKVLKFKSIIDAANFLSNNGWVLEQAYSAPHTAKKNLKHWVFSKEASGYDEVKAGFLSKKEYKMLKREKKALQEQ